MTRPLVVDASFTVLAASAAAAAFDLVEGGTLPNDELRALVRRVRTSDSVATETSATETMRLRRGAPPAEPRLVVVRATRISPRLTLLVLRDITERERVEADAPRLRREHEPRAEDAGGRGEPARRGDRVGRRRPAAGAHLRRRGCTAEAARLALLTSRIMNLSRLQAADELADERDVSVDEVVASALDAHAIQADSAGVEVVRGGARGLYVRGDAQMLSEAVGNLIANAIAYSPRGSSVGSASRPSTGVVEIAVTDRGIGIAEGEQDRVFERFYRADQARARRTGGTGLGLSIVKHAVQRHGGEVRLWSRPGRGSTFTIRLPQIDAPTSSRCPSARAGRSGPPRSRPRVRRPPPRACPRPPTRGCPRRRRESLRPPLRVRPPARACPQPPETPSARPPARTSPPQNGDPA